MKRDPDSWQCLSRDQKEFVREADRFFEGSVEDAKLARERERIRWRKVLDECDIPF